MSRDNGGPAFPMQVHYDVNGERYSYEPGMSLRVWLAGMAMQGMLANSSLVDDHGAHAIQWITMHAYQQADAMMEERAKCGA